MITSSVNVFYFKKISQFLSLDEATCLQNVTIMKLWQGKRILVTGGAVRIGKGFVESFQAAGAEVVVHYQHSKAEAEALSAYTVKADLSDLSSVEQLLSQTRSY